MRTVVTFKSAAFNTSEPRDYFLNPGCFGDDVARWLIQRLQEEGIQPVGEPEQEDFGWYIAFCADNATHQFLIGFRPGDAAESGDWVGWIERKRGFVGSLLGWRRRGVRLAAAQAIHRVLSASPTVSNIRWHLPRDFDRGLEDAGAGEP
jgi:hypothetical protein